MNKTQLHRQAQLKELSSVLTLRCMKKLHHIQAKDVTSRGKVVFELRVRHRLLVDGVHATRVASQVNSGLSQPGYRYVDVRVVPATRYHLMGDTASDITESVACIIFGFCVVPLAELAKEVRGAWATVKVSLEV